MLLGDAVRANVIPGDAIHVYCGHTRWSPAVTEVVRQWWGRDPGFTLEMLSLSSLGTLWFRGGLVRKVVTGYSGDVFPNFTPNPVFSEAYLSGAVEVEHWSFLAFALRYEAAARGLPVAATRSLLGSSMETNPGVEVFRTAGGDEVALLEAHAPDVALVHGAVADAEGNVALHPPLLEGVWGALAARRGVIATVERIVPDIRPWSNLVVIPSHRTLSVSECPFGAHPGGLYGRFTPAEPYAEDLDFWTDARGATRGDDLDGWIRRWVLDLPDHAAYLEQLGAPRLATLSDRARADSWRDDEAANPPDLTAPVNAWERAAVHGARVLAAATAGLPVAIAAAALPFLVVGVWFAWPAVRELVLTPPEDLRPRAAASLPAAKPSTVGSLGSLLVVGAAGVAAFFVAGLGFKGVLVAAATLAGGAALIVVRDRSSFGMFAATVSLTFVLHKSFSAQFTTVSGGAISVFITTFDAMLLVLIGLWIAEGTFLSDLRVGMRRKVMWTPLIGALFLLPSMLATTTPLLAVAELTRMGWMYLLFVYMAVRVRTRRQVGMVLAGLGAFAAIEVAVILMQWKTGGVLGLEFLGVPKELGERVTDTASIGRPFGTIIHPVFMGAVMSAIGLVALSFALGRRNGLARTAAWLTLAGSMGAMYISHTRAALVAFVAVAAWVVWGSWRRGEVTTKQLKGVALVALACFVVALPALIPKFEENFGTGHFYEEINSRQQLNVIGVHMWADHPFVGVGLNNFEQVMGPYQQQGIIFFNNPVHNLYLLFLAETGLVGFVGFLVAGIGAVLPAFRLCRARDPFLRSVGRGVAAAAIFFAVEELLGFSLRQDIPLALFWLLAGLSIACLNIAEREGVEFGPPSPITRRSRVKAPVPTRGPQPNRSLTGSTPRVARGLLRATLLPAAVVTLLGAASLPPSAAAEPATLRVVFSATDRATGQSGIYVAGPDRQALRITPADGRVYSWPQFAFGDTKIVYTVRSGQPGSPESIYVADSDGSAPVLVRAFSYRVAQPKVAPDGSALIFTAQPPWYPQVGIFRLDLRSGEVTNLSALSSPASGTDSDPRYGQDGRAIVFAQTSKPNTQIALMGADGTGRRALTDDAHSNVDPDISPDGREIVYSSYQGQGSARSEGGDLAIRPADWKIVSQAARPWAPTRALTVKVKK